MKKTFGLYAIAWTLALGLFNVIAFVSPALLWQEKYTFSFWCGYVLITLCFVGQLACTAMAFKADSAKKFFYNISLITTSFSGLIASLIVGGICMLITSFAYWIGVIGCAIVLVCNVVAVLRAKAAVDAVSAVDQKIQTGTLFIRSLTVDAESLMARATTDEMRAICKRAYEAIRYSDPMSHEALASTETQITVSFHTLFEAVVGGDEAGARAAADTLVILVGDRNKKCKLLK